MLLHLVHPIRILIVTLWLLLSAATSAIAAETHTFAVEAAECIGNASRISDTGASGGTVVRLSRSGQGVRFTHLPAESKLAIHYASVGVGTISVTVNDEPVRKVNIHSSGALTHSFLNAIIDITIPSGATLIIRLTNDDIPVSIDRIVVGDGNLELPPDIWNLPPLPVAPVLILRTGRH